MNEIRIKSKIRIKIRNGTCRLVGQVVTATLLACSAWAGPPPTAVPLPESESQGQALAERIRSAEPEENSEIHGTLIIRRNKQVTRVPVVCRVVLKGATWETIYETSATADTGAEKLVVTHSTNGPNQYLYARASGPGEPAGKPAPVPAADTDRELAGSDFSLADLGLEFLHWPQQVRLPDETHLGQACYVLESRNPDGPQVVRVRSDIDQESGGLLIATGFDTNSRAIKDFSLSGSSFKKVNGHWQLEKMEIRNHRLKSQTELKFDISE
jgi:outer membrane lipoprotein-sorting protein